MLHAAEQAGHLDAPLGSGTRGQDRHVAHGAAPDPSPAGDRGPPSIVDRFERHGGAGFLAGARDRGARPRCAGSVGGRGAGPQWCIRTPVAGDSAPAGAR
jgi:hypothetical protein